MTSIDWVCISRGHWLGFDGVKIMARIEKIGPFQYQWWFNEETAVMQTARDARSDCERGASE